MKYNEMMNKAKIAVAGVALMSDVIDQIATRRRDIVEDVLEKTLGVKHDAGNAVTFEAAMNKRAEGVDAFDAYEDRVAELEAALEKVRTLAQTPIYDGTIKVMTTRFDISDVCREVLNNGTR